RRVTRAARSALAIAAVASLSHPARFARGGPGQHRHLAPRRSDHRRALSGALRAAFDPVAARGRVRLERRRPARPAARRRSAIAARVPCVLAAAVRALMVASTLAPTKPL